MTTFDLEEKIKKSKRFSTRLISENSPPEFAEFLQQCMDEKGVRKNEIIKILNIHRNYGYQMLNGSRIPSREQIIRISLFLGLDLEKTQKLLILAKRDTLYVRRIEDARTIHCIEHNVKYKRACEFIWRDK